MDKDGAIIKNILVDSSGFINIVYQPNLKFAVITHLSFCEGNDEYNGQILIDDVPVTVDQMREILLQLKEEGVIGG